MSNNSLLVIGGGFSGISAALEAAELGFEVFLVEKTPYLGGRVMQLNKYFPKICPPSCGLEIQYQRIKNNPNVKFFTQAEVTSLSGYVGNMTAKVKIKPRHTAPSSVDYSEYADSLKGKTESEFELGMGKRKALHMDAPFAFPNRWVLEADELNDADKKALADAPGIDLSEKEKEISLSVGAVVVATGWQPYDIANLDNLGGGAIQNVVSNMQFERIASPHGPTEGKIVRPSDGKEAKRVCFVQCAGSRDENHLSYCSYICCMASLKQATYVREQYPDASCFVYYIDLRTPGRYQNFREKVLSDPGINAVKGKVAECKEDPATGDVLVTVENAVAGIKGIERFDLVVLAAGMQPSIAGNGFAQKVPGINVDEEGFIISGEDKGIFTTGCAKKPLDVMGSAKSAAGAAMKAIQAVRGR